MIIDIHAHIYPDRIAAKAAKSIGDFYHWPMAMDGTAATLLEAGAKAGIDRFVVHSAAVTWERVQPINDFLAGQADAHPEHFIGFGTMHPDYQQVEQELDRLMKLGLCGIKLHPDVQHFCVDAPASIRMLEAAEERGLPVLFHTGDQRYPFSQPERMARALDHVPNLRAICAHLGGWSMWSEGWKLLAGRANVYVDCSSSLFAITPEEAVHIIHRYGASQVLFGTDYHMWEPGEEMERFRRLPLTEQEQELILHENAERLLKL